MSAHDFLMSKYLELKALLGEYVEEFDPPYADNAFEYLVRSMMAVTHFIDEGPDGP